MLIERLNPELPPTLVWRDGQPREWAPISQIVRHYGLDESKLSQALHASFALPVKTFEEREQTPLIDSQIPSKTGPKHIIIHHVVTADDTVVGLLMWIDSPQVPVEPRPRSAGMMFGKGVTSPSKDTFMLRAHSLEHFGTFADADQFFNRVTRFPDLTHVIELCNSDDPDSVPPLMSRVTIVHDDLHLVNLQIVAKRSGPTTFGMGLDITQGEPPQMDPLTAMRATGTAPAGLSRGYIAFGRAEADPRPPSVVYWVTDPPPQVAYWTAAGPTPREGRGLIHLDDVAALHAAREDIDAGATLSPTVPVRFRSCDGSWVKVAATLSPNPGGSVKGLYVIDVVSAE